MPAFDPPLNTLEADQRAVLELVLIHKKRYAEIATLLAIDSAAVKKRATAALVTLVNAPAPPERQLALAVDYLLGQQPASLRLASRQAIEQSNVLRTWLLAAAAILRPIAKIDLPEIPQPEPEIDAAFGALQARKQRQETVQRSSRLGGILIISLCTFALTAVIIIFLTRDDGKKERSNTAENTVSATNQAQTNSGQTSELPIDQQVNLYAAGSNKKAVGVARIVRQENQRLLALAADSLRPTARNLNYAVWLSGGPGGSTKRLGFTRPVGKQGRVQAVSRLPGNVARYRTLLLTLERSATTKKPGIIVLRGELTLKE